jgi:hypothetical protein
MGTAAVVGLLGASAALLLGDFSPSPLRLLDFEISYIRSDADGDRSAGQLGRDVFDARQGDAVRLKATFSRPAYAYLLALRADGQVEVCWPEDEDAKPPLSDSAYYPSINPTHMYGLDEAVGQWAFLVVASAEELPSFRQWRAERGLPRQWEPRKGTAGTVWEFTHSEISNVSVLGTTRGKGRVAKDAELLGEVAHWFKTIPQVEIVEGRAFVVHPRP